MGLQHIFWDLLTATYHIEQASSGLTVAKLQLRFQSQTEIDFKWLEVGWLKTGRKWSFDIFTTYWHKVGWTSWMLKVGWSPSTRFPGHGSLGPGLRALAHCETNHHDVPWPSWLVQNFVAGKCARTMQRLTMVKLGHFPMGISMSWWWFKPMGISMFWCWNVEELLYEEWSLQHVVAPGSTPGLSRIDWK